MRSPGIAILVAAAVFFCGRPASVQAEVKQQSVTGFAVSHQAVVAASPDAVWAELIQPAHWWSGEHSWSGSASNFTLSARAGGCFCETLPDGGFAEHARIIHAVPGKLLRMSGAFGPLQSEALTGTLTILLTPEAGGTRVRFDYIVGGYARFDLAPLAPAVDAVIGEQQNRLVLLFATGHSGEGDPAR